MSLVNQPTDFFKLALKNNNQHGDLEHKQNYYLIVNELSNSKSWQTLFEQLSFCVTYIDKCYTDLLAAVWNFNVKEASTVALENFLEFLINLNSAHGGLYLENTYTLLLRAFREGLDESVDINEGPEEKA